MTVAIIVIVIVVINEEEEENDMVAADVDGPLKQVALLSVLSSTMENKEMSTSHF